nr:probable LRR receptor-like serine/threonine-protein kinase At1g56140 [Ipomoea batatas]
MGILGFSFFVLGLLNTVIAQSNITDPNEVVAINKIIDHWNLRSKVNLSSFEPCDKNASWAPLEANPRIACDCSGTFCHINRLKIYGLDIVGEIPKELFVLKEMMDLNLAQNVLNGSVPAEIGQLTKMKWLSFGTNNLTGPIPPEIGNLSILITLSFATNNMNGPLPPELGNLTTLEEMYIDSNRFTGPIPEELSKLKNLRVLWASSNNFTGKLPELFGSLTDLAVLRLEGTLLEGPIPKSYGALTKLDDLRIGDINNADSSLDFIEKVSSISILSLRNCRIAGQLPEWFSKFSNLKILYLGSNNLSGELPANIITDTLFLNAVGTLITSKRSLRRSVCLAKNSVCTEKASSTSLSIKCGGNQIVTVDGIQFDDDSEMLGPASFYMSSNNQWAGERVLRDFNVKQEAGGSKRALVKKFKANVTNNVLDIHFFWAGKGTCCIPVQSTFGPIVSAIHVTQEVNLDDSSDGSDKKRIGKIIGITLGSAAGVLIICTIFYVWWRKKKSPTYKGF